jgi:hypothetical protein
MKLKAMAAALALVIGSGVAQAQTNQWNSVDNLVSASNDIRTTLDLGIRRVGGLTDLTPTGVIAPDGYMDVETLQMTEAKANAYNLALQEVQADVFSKTATEYFTEQYEIRQADFAAAVDNYVLASAAFIEATYINELASEVQLTGDAVLAQSLQAYITENSLGITSTMVSDYNSSMTAVGDAAEQWGAVAAVYNDPAALENLQAGVDAAGQDFMNANDTTYDHIAQQSSITFFAGNQVVIIENQFDHQGVTSDFVQAGNNSGFYITGPTQDVCSFYPSADPANPCYLEPTP